MVVPEDRIRPAEEEDNRHAVEVVVVPVAIEEGHLEEGPIHPAAVADLLVEDPNLPAVVVEDPILLVEAADLLEGGPNYRAAVEAAEDPNCPVAEGIAGHNRGSVVDSHLRTEVAEGVHRMTCLA